MDITSMLSSDEGPSKQSPVAQRTASSGSTQVLSGNGIRPPPPPLSRHSSQQSGPGWPTTPHETDPYAQSAKRHTPTASLTPLQTRGPPGQFPFSGQMSASPGGYPQQHTPLAHTPGGHPQYLPHQSQPPSLGQHHLQGPHPQAYRQQTSSSSPTPSSQHSQPQYGIRQSPLVATSHLPQQPPPHLQQYQSHPGTPLGPPSLQQRGSAHSAHQDPYSPLHQRNLSGMSNGIIGGSPAHGHMHMGQPSTQAQATTEYFNQLDRERSLSVSPKTQVPVRVPSLGSRQSSYQEPQSARSSMQHVPMAQPTETQNHVMHALQNGAGVSQAIPHATPQVLHSNAVSVPSPMPVPAPPPQHQAQKMGMNRLITPAPASVKQSPVAMNVSLKRSASPDMLSAAPRSKIAKKRPTERPPWARLHAHNPHYKTQGHPATTNGHGTNEAESKPPSRDGPKAAAVPDTCLANARELLGGWEASYQGKALNPSMYKVVQDWLWMKLSDLSEIDPSLLEIEAKIGKLLNKSDGNRVNFGVSSTCTVAESHNHLMSFDSQMDPPEYKAINEALNASVLKAQQPGREPMKYKRIEQTDSSHHLNSAGLALIPPALKQYTSTRPTRLRISHDKATSALKAAIIKLPVSNLHIHAPDGQYDCRISINIELNLLPLLAASNQRLEDIIDHGAPVEASRQKNRMNYKHLAYDIDLTAVSQGEKTSYELELEVDASLLKSHMGFLMRREPSAYVEIVSGFLENAQFLMRAR